MIITRTPFRITLGGGGTDLPSYYRQHGGFLLTSAIDKYMYVAINTPFIDRLLRVKYSKSETVASAKELEHELVREALKIFNIEDTLEIISFADISAGTGMGSSGSYLVGLLNALNEYNKYKVSAKQLAETAFHIEAEILKKPVGKQDGYIAAHGGILCLQIDKEGNVSTKPANIKMTTIRDLEHNLLLYYTGIQRKAEEVLQEQHQAMLKKDHGQHKAVSESLNWIKDLGFKTLQALEEDRLSEFARLMDEHWRYKKKMSNKITHPAVDQAYEEVKRHGVLGGKLLGAGGGGFLLFYAETNHRKIEQVMAGRGMRRLDFRFDFEGSKVLLNFSDSRIEYQHAQERDEIEKIGWKS